MLGGLCGLRRGKENFERGEESWTAVSSVVSVNVKWDLSDVHPLFDACIPPTISLHVSTTSPDLGQSGGGSSNPTHRLNSLSLESIILSQPLTHYIPNIQAYLPSSQFHLYCQPSHRQKFPIITHLLTLKKINSPNNPCILHPS